jgi:hypothetical protein
VGAAAGENFAAVSSGKAGAKSVTALSDDLTWLIGALHGTIPWSFLGQFLGQFPVGRGRAYKEFGRSSQILPGGRPAMNDAVKRS